MHCPKFGSYIQLPNLGLCQQFLVDWQFKMGYLGIFLPIYSKNNRSHTIMWRMILTKWSLLVLVVSLFFPGNLSAEVINVAVAANFNKPLRQLATVFESQTSHRVLVSSGSTGKIYAQTVHGAPYHLFLSADVHHPKLLEETGMAVSGSRFTYAMGRLVLWSSAATGKTVDETFFNHENPKIIAMANPKVAPYGRAAEEVLESLGVLQHFSERTALGENVGQTLSFVASKTVSTGFVALSQILSLKDKIPTQEVWKIPQQLYSPLRQDAILLRPGEHHAGALAFMAFLKSQQARSIIEKMGYWLE